ncbi:JM127 [macacine gammaherpesvirus 11]|uniref:JM127 n=2 Tax=macacine gammaherpesvirus 11 TaxID=2560570 RepID=G9JMV5_9GAMA|nr:JM127 [Macaca fuscata rhadinovirus]AAT00104.1 JM127 [Macaca fuscata rhadinovirus]AEW87652.1 JM127 [Macaca fuscata rhadinovirus]AEW87822.1 JM127 [Macaca fuscata rhadinovirus]
MVWTARRRASVREDGLLLSSASTHSRIRLLPSVWSVFVTVAVERKRVLLVRMPSILARLSDMLSSRVLFSSIIMNDSDDARSWMAALSFSNRGFREVPIRAPAFVI